LLKRFAVLGGQFRQNVDMHGKVFGAVANLVQANIMLEDATYQIDYCNK